MRCKAAVVSLMLSLGLLLLGAGTAGAEAACSSTYPAALCPAPSVPTGHPAAPAGAVASTPQAPADGGGLAFTGFDAGAVALIGLGAIGAGVALTRASRRRA